MENIKTEIRVTELDGEFVSSLQSNPQIERVSIELQGKTDYLLSRLDQSETVLALSQCPHLQTVITDTWHEDLAIGLFKKSKSMRVFIMNAGGKEIPDEVREFVPKKPGIAYVFVCNYGFFPRWYHHFSKLNKELISSGLYDKVCVIPYNIAISTRIMSDGVFLANIEEIYALFEFLLNGYVEERHFFTSATSGVNMKLIEENLHIPIVRKNFLQMLLYSPRHKDVLYACAELGIIPEYDMIESTLKAAVEVGQIETIAYLQDAIEALFDKKKIERQRRRQEAYDLLHPYSKHNISHDWEWKYVPYCGKQNGAVVLTKYIGHDVETLIVPNTVGRTPVISIGVGACKEVKAQKVVIQEGIKKIDENAFLKSEVKEVVFPQSLRIIGNSAFCNTHLLSVDLPASITLLGHNAFKGCKLLQNVVFHGSLCEIPDYCFCDCEALTSVKLPDQLRWIGEGAFSHCVKLRVKDLPASCILRAIRTFFTPVQSRNMT